MILTPHAWALPVMQSKKLQDVTVRFELFGRTRGLRTEERIHIYRYELPLVDDHRDAS
ncbi:MAG TPA: hypothetical protein VFP59_03340 [Candidatus Angelobacter sp.]|nr:hypothetical protein [Candidatus Angelobacter sp.]